MVDPGCLLQRRWGRSLVGLGRPGEHLDYLLEGGRVGLDKGGRARIGVFRSSHGARGALRQLAVLICWTVRVRRGCDVGGGSAAGAAGGAVACGGRQERKWVGAFTVAP